MTYQEAFEDFMSRTDEVEDAIRMATSQGYVGTSTATLELFDDGTYRVLDSVGNLYNSRGLLIGVPELMQSDDSTYVYTKDNEQIDSSTYADLDADEQALWTEIKVDAYFDNAVDQFREHAEYAINEANEYDN